MNLYYWVSLLGEEDGGLLCRPEWLRGWLSSDVRDPVPLEINKLM